MCYIFESNNDGEKVVCPFICLAGGVTHPSYCLIVCLLHAFQICDSIGLAKQISLHSEMVKTVTGGHSCVAVDVYACFLIVALVMQDRKAVEKKKEEDKAKEKQKEELSKQRQIEKVIFFFTFQHKPCTIPVL